MSSPSSPSLSQDLPGPASGLTIVFPDEDVFTKLHASNKKLENWKTSRSFLSSLLLYYRLMRVEFELSQLYRKFKRDLNKRYEEESQNLEIIWIHFSLLFGKNQDKRGKILSVNCNNLADIYKKSNDTNNATYTNTNPFFVNNVTENSQHYENSDSLYYKSKDFTFIVNFEKELLEAKEILPLARRECAQRMKRGVEKSITTTSATMTTAIRSGVDIDTSVWKKEVKHLAENIKYFTNIMGKGTSWSLFHPIESFLRVEEQDNGEEIEEEEEPEEWDKDKERRGKEIMYGDNKKEELLIDLGNEEMEKGNHKKYRKESKRRKNFKESRPIRSISLQFIYECIHVDRNISFASLLLDAEPVVADIFIGWCKNESNINLLDANYIRTRHDLLIPVFRHSHSLLKKDVNDNVNENNNDDNNDNDKTPSLSTSSFSSASLSNVQLSIDQSLNPYCLHKNLSLLIESTISKFTPLNLLRCGITFNEIIYLMNYSIEELHQYQYHFSAKKLKEEGVSLEGLLEGGYALKELKDARYSVNEIQQSCKILQPKTCSFLSLSSSLPSTSKEEKESTQEKSAAFSSSITILPTITDYVKAGYDAYDLRQGGFTLDDFARNNLLADQLIETEKLPHLAQEDEDQKDQKEQKGDSNEMEEAIKLFTILDLKRGGYSIVELCEVGYSCEQLKNGGGFPLESLIGENVDLFTLQELVLAGFTAYDFKIAEVPLHDLLSESIFNENALIQAGYKKSDIIHYKEKCDEFVTLHSPSSSAKNFSGSSFGDSRQAKKTERKSILVTAQSSIFRKSTSFSSQSQQLKRNGSKLSQNLIEYEGGRESYSTFDERETGRNFTTVASFSDDNQKQNRESKYVELIDFGS